MSYISEQSFEQRLIRDLKYSKQRNSSKNVESSPIINVNQTNPPNRRRKNGGSFSAIFKQSQNDSSFSTIDSSLSCIQIAKIINKRKHFPLSQKKVTFEPFPQVIEVESYKNYNYLDDFLIESQEHQVCPKCSCSIF